MRESVGFVSQATRSMSCAFGLVCLLICASGCNSSSVGVTAPPPPPAVPNLIISVSHIGNFVTGQQGATYTVIVTNNGTAPTNGAAATVTDVLPNGMTLVSMAGTGWSCASNTCTRSDVLPSGGSYPAIATAVNVAANAASSETNQVSVSGGGSASANGSDPTTIISPPSALSITMTHTGDFSIGQNLAGYTVTVSNAANAAEATSGTVTVTETTPVGETSAWASGIGWDCTTVPFSCARSDPLAPGQSYPPIKFQVNVGAKASSPQVNAVQVTGGNSAPANTTESNRNRRAECLPKYAVRERVRDDRSIRGRRSGLARECERDAQCDSFQRGFGWSRKDQGSRRRNGRRPGPQQRRHGAKSFCN